MLLYAGIKIWVVLFSNGHPIDLLAGKPDLPRSGSYALFCNTTRIQSIAEREADPLLAQFIFGYNPHAIFIQKLRQSRIGRGNVLELLSVSHVLTFPSA